MPDRSLNWGDSEADARYRTQDSDPTGGDFVVVEDLSGGGQLLIWDYSAGEWAYGGPVNMGGNDITNAGTVSTATLEATESLTATSLTVSSDPENPTEWLEHSSNGALTNQSEVVGFDITADGTPQKIIDVRKRESGLILVRGEKDNQNSFAELVLIAGATGISKLSDPAEKGTTPTRSYSFEGTGDVAVSISDSVATYTMAVTLFGGQFGL